MKLVFTYFRHIVFASAMLCSVAMYAQTNIYITHPTTPETTSVVAGVDSICFTNGQALFRSGSLSKVFNAKDVHTMGWKEHDLLRKQIMPESFRSDFDFDITFSDADRMLAGQAEPIVTQIEDKAYEDFVNNSAWTRHLTITYGGKTATVNGNVDGVEIQIDGNHVVVNSMAQEVEYTLTGNAEDGSFKLYGSDKAKLVLNGLHLSNTKGPAINNQCKKRLFLVLADGTDNVLTDGFTYIKTTGEDADGCIFSEGQICLSGSGALTVNGQYKNGIATDDYLHVISGFVRVTTSANKGHAIKIKDDFILGGGALHLLAQGTAAKGVNAFTVTVTGGKLTAIVTGDAIWDAADQDYSSACGVKSDSVMHLLGGEIRVLATGIGGKGVNVGQQDEKGDDLIIDGVNLYIRTSGERLQDTQGSTSPKGIKSSHNIEVKSGNIYVRCSGGDGAEGLEAKHDINFWGGKLRSYCYDDGANAINSEIHGGDIFVCSTANDGYDCNGGLYINGGTLYAIGASGAQAGIDNDGKTFGMNGGSVVSVGGYSSIPWDSKSNQASVLCYLKKAVNYVALVDADGNNVLTVKTPGTYNPLGVLLSSPNIQVGKTYKLLSFDTLDGGKEVGGVIEQPQYTNATTEYEFTPTNLLTTLGSKQ